MGQKQSSTSSGTSPGEANHDKTDYYELLAVERNATDEEIKKAYRRKALELHPDRNYGNVDAATKLFAEIQSAYEVLADPQERAWYDSHRDAILRGDGANAGGEQYSYDTRMTTASDILSLFTKFSPRMEFSDSPSGFFGGLCDTFDQLAREEELACQWEGLDPVEYPSFGSRDDDYEDIVRPFYAAWNGFATKKTFSWKDAYRLSEAPDRRVRRLMEKENKRRREEGIREFNDTVRSFVAFARKRDPRCKANAQSEAERQKTLRDAAAAQAARSRAANEARIKDHTIPDWAKTQGPVEEEGNFSSESESEQELFECVVCRKGFKSEKQFEAHERSKKHIKAVKQLRWEMRTQDKHFNLNGEEKTSEIEPPVPAGDLPTSSVDIPLTEDDTRPPSTEQSPMGMNDSVLVENTVFLSRPEGSDGEDDYASQEVVTNRVLSGRGYGAASDKDKVIDLAEDLSASNLDDEPLVPAPKIGKAKQKRAKKAAQKAALEQPEFRCAACNAEFPSKTKLFSHIRELQHSQPSTKPSRPKGSKR